MRTTMNEHLLKAALTRFLRSGGSLKIDEVTFQLVCWELMFPSWKINYKVEKWNERSVDFILTNAQNQLVCLEIKNIVRSKNELFSAWCQAMHRSILFGQQYVKAKLAMARSLCIDLRQEERTPSKEGKWATLQLPDRPEFLIAVGVAQCPALAQEWFADWNQMDWEALKSAGQPLSNKIEFNRLMAFKDEVDIRKMKVDLLELPVDKLT